MDERDIHKKGFFVDRDERLSRSAGPANSFSSILKGFRNQI